MGEGSGELGTFNRGTWQIEYVIAQESNLTSRDRKNSSRNARKRHMAITNMKTTRGNSATWKQHMETYARKQHMKTTHGNNAWETYCITWKQHMETCKYTPEGGFEGTCREQYGVDWFGKTPTTTAELRKEYYALREIGRQQKSRKRRPGQQLHATHSIIIWQYHRDHTKSKTTW